jgi:hypothetical protein
MKRNERQFLKTSTDALKTENGDRHPFGSPLGAKQPKALPSNIPRTSAQRIHVATDGCVCRVRSESPPAPKFASRAQSFSERVLARYPNPPIG